MKPHALWIALILACSPAWSDEVTDDPNIPGYAPVIERTQAEAAVEEKEPEGLDIPSIDAQNETRSHASVTYVTGGIGDDEKQAIEASKADYNLHVMSASLNGAFVGDAQVVITRKKGEQAEEMLSVVAGPLLYVRLPAGTYTLTAKLGAQDKKQVFTVTEKGKPARVHLGWKTATVN